jgi:simple sugar transport system substrate-binding protein
MSEHDILGDAVERLEWSDKKSDAPVSKIAQVTRRTALTGGAAGLAAVLLEACGSSGDSGTTNANAASSSSQVESIFGVKGGYRFSMVNHVTTNDFFTPTQNGASDACKLLNCSYQWGGSETSSVTQMVNVINSAISAGVDGIATTLISPTAFNKPVANAIKAGIPTVAYNADAVGNARLAYIGQDLYVSGQQVGQHIKALIPGGGDIVVFIATPGSSNLQPRLDGIQAELKGSNITVHTTATGAAQSQEVSTVQSFVSSHPTYKGFFAVDGGSTEAVASAIKKNGLKGKVAAGGYDLTPTTEDLLAAGYIDFTIDQQPYLQGFLPILELFLYKASQGLTGPADVDTGLKFLNSKTVVPYSSTKSEYEGTGTKPGVQKA